MLKTTQPELSIVVPVLNEVEILPMFQKDLLAVLRATKLTYEIIYCDDGSSDGSKELVQSWAEESSRVRLICLSRNFGKELATTAGLGVARGKAVLMIDADGQHPVERIPEFLACWRAGAKVVVGIRATNQKEGFIKRNGSRLHRLLVRRLTHTDIVPAATDFRLIDQVVQRQFNALTEHNRITRGLIDWLGYERTYITFDAKAREHGEASYSVTKLTKLAIDSLISLSSAPLYISAFIGIVTFCLAALLGIVMLLNFVLHDPLNLHATGGSYLIVLILFLLSILLTVQGLIGLYVSHIYSETQNRPLYIVDEQASRGLQHD